MTINSSQVPVTQQINSLALEILEKHPQGVRWVDLLKQVEANNSSFHPKTANDCVWKLVEKYPDQVYKPEKGPFKLKKYS